MVNNLKFEGQKLATWYFTVAMVLFGAQLLMGLIAATQFLYPSFLFEIFDFSTARMVHINALVVWMVASLIVSATGLDIVTSISTVASTLNNVGPALAKAGPAENYAFISPLGKWILTFCMLIGRLEYYTVLILLIPNFWRK